MEWYTPWNYYTDINRNKKYIQARSTMAYCLGVSPCAVELIQFKIVMGVGQTK